MKIPSALKIDELAELYALARFACNQIERHAADLVLVGMDVFQSWGETCPETST